MYCFDTLINRYFFKLILKLFVVVLDLISSGKENQSFGPWLMIVNFLMFVR